MLFSYVVFDRLTEKKDAKVRKGFFDIAWF